MIVFFNIYSVKIIWFKKMEWYMLQKRQKYWEFSTNKYKYGKFFAVAVRRVRGIFMRHHCIQQWYIYIITKLDQVMMLPLSCHSVRSVECNAVVTKSIAENSDSLHCIFCKGVKVLACMCMKCSWLKNYNLNQDTTYNAECLFNGSIFSRTMKVLLTQSIACIVSYGQYWKKWI